MASLKAEKPVGTQLFGQAKKEPAASASTKAPPSKSAPKKSAPKPQEPKKKAAGGKSGSKKQ